MARKAKSTKRLTSSRELHLHTLPEDVIIAVLKPLDTADRARAGAACKALHRLVRRASPLWEEVEFSGDLGQEDTALKAEQFMAWLLRKAPAVKELNLTLKIDDDAEVDPEQEPRMWAYILAAMVACREGLKKLRLQWDGTLEIGAWLCGFGQLTSVKLVAHELTLGNGLSDLPSLRMHLSSMAAAARINSLPTALTYLDLEDCRLEALPACLATLQRLEDLVMHSNNLQHAHFGALTVLTQLTSLCVTECGLATVPREIGALTRLQSLYLGVTLAQEQDLSVLSSLGQLELLQVGGCRLQSPPPLVQLTSLRRLSAWDNALHEWPAGPWVGSLEMLCADLGSLTHWTDALRGAHKLQRLFITREQDEEGLEQLHFDLLLDALCSLPALVEVAYVIDSTDRVVPPEQRAFTNMLLVLARQPQLLVHMLEWDKMADIILGVLHWQWQ